MRCCELGALQRRPGHIPSPAPASLAPPQLLPGRRRSPGSRCLLRSALERWTPAAAPPSSTATAWRSEGRTSCLVRVGGRRKCTARGASGGSMHSLPSHVCAPPRRVPPPLQARAWGWCWAPAPDAMSAPWPTRCASRRARRACCGALRPWLHAARDHRSPAAAASLLRINSMPTDTHISALCALCQRACLPLQKPTNAFQRGVRRVSYLLIAFMACMVRLYRGAPAALDAPAG